MPKIKYQDINLSEKSLALIETCNQIIAEYTAQGYILTLRQLYYQTVARGIIPNKQSEYKRIGSIINDGRLAGLIDWSALEDRTRNLESVSHWDSPEQIIRAVANQYAIDKWDTQDVRPECFTPTTPALSNFLPISIGSVQIGDSVMTHDGYQKEVTKVIRRHYRGNMLRLKAAGLLPIDVTPYHPFWAERHSGKCKGAERKFSRVAWNESQNLSVHDRLRVPLLRSRKPILDTQLDLKGGPRSTKFTIELTLETLRVLGLYAAEGSVRADGRTVQLVFNATELGFVELVTGWADCFGIPYSTAAGKGTAIVYVFSKALAMWLEDCFGNGAYEKRIPLWLMQADATAQITFLEYYFRGDGSLWDASRSAIRATSRSITLAQQVQLMFLYNRFSASLHMTMDHGAPRYEVSVAGQSVVDIAEVWGIAVPPKGLGRSKRYNHILFTDTDALFPIRSITEFYYDGPVVNLEVRDAHSYCVPVSVHNCWVEKEALAGVVERICNQLDVAHFSCRGYVSQSEMWVAAQRFIKYAKNGQRTHVIHLGDHDPSGIDMSRDITDRIRMFMARHGYGAKWFDFTRIALNMDQVQQYNPPPNPAKSSDSRFQGYMDEHGDESWELDALEPQVLSDLIRAKVDELRDEAVYAEKQEQEEHEKEQLGKVSDRWDAVAEFVGNEEEASEDD